MGFASLHILLNDALGNVGSVNCSHTYRKHQHTVSTTILLHLQPTPHPRPQTSSSSLPGQLKFEEAIEQKIELQLCILSCFIALKPKKK